MIVVTVRSDRRHTPELREHELEFYPRAAQIENEPVKKNDAR